MTDRELDVLVAKKVMGWHPGRNLPSSWSDPPGWFDAQAFVQPAESWKPSTDTATARLVVKKMAADGFWVHINGPFEPGQLYGVGFTPHNITGWKENPHHQAFDALLSRAICLAALAAKDAKIPTEGER